VNLLSVKTEQLIIAVSILIVLGGFLFIENNNPTGAVISNLGGLDIMAVPTHETPTLTITDYPHNRTGHGELIVVNQSTAVGDGVYVKNMISWEKTGANILFFNMPFENNTINSSNGTRDYANGGNNGTVVGAIWQNDSGYDSHGAYNFSGAQDYIQISNSASLNEINSQSDFSIEMWIMPNNITYPDSTIGINLIAKKDLDNFGYQLKFAQTNDLFSLMFYIDGASPPLSVDSPSLVVGEWYHLVVTFRAGSITIYLNGEELTSDSGWSSTIPGSMEGDLYIGYVPDFSDLSFNGTIDEVRLYHLALPSQQVLLHYQNHTDYLYNTIYGLDEEWSACVTPNDGLADGLTKCTLPVTIKENQAPTQNSLPILNASTDLNLSEDNLTAYNLSIFDLENGNVTLIYNWTVNNSPLLVLNLPFEGNDRNEQNTAKDYSGKNNDGSVGDSLIWNSTIGYNGRGAYIFDGIVSLDVSTSESLSLNNNAISVELRFNASSLANPSDKNLDLLHKNGAYVIRFENITESRLIFSAGDFFQSMPLQSADNFETNRWYHIVGTYDGNVQKLYVDGVEVNSLVCNEQMSDPNIDSILIGNNFEGIIDEVRIYNRSLSAEQVFALYQNQTNVIVSNETALGETWAVSITPNDGEDDGLTKTSAELLLNIVPEIISVINLTTFTTYANTTLNTTNITYTDRNNQAGSVYFQWYVNNTLVANYTASSVANGTNVTFTLTSGNFTKYSEVNFSVYATDSFSNTTTVWSSTATILNVVPTFNTTLIGKSANSSLAFTYQMNCSDYDGDTLTYYDNISLFTINSTTGLITDSPLQSEAGNYSINITCSDGTVNITQNFTYRILDTTAAIVTFSSLLTPNSNITPDLNVSTGEVATCQYKNSTSDYANMATTGGTTHSQKLNSLSTGEHTLYVQCNDSAQNRANNSLVVVITSTIVESSNNTLLNLTSNLTQTVQLLNTINVTLNLSTTLNDTILTVGEYNTTPLSSSFALTGYTTAVYRYYTFSASDELKNAINQLTFHLYYNETQLTTLGISESALKVYFYNLTTSAWQQERNYSINTTSDFVEVNVTHLSTFTLGKSTVTAAATEDTTAASSSSSSSGATGWGVCGDLVCNDGEKCAATKDINQHKGPCAKDCGVCKVTSPSSSTGSNAEIPNTNKTSLMDTTPTKSSDNPKTSSSSNLIGKAFNSLSTSWSNLDKIWLVPVIALVLILSFVVAYLLTRRKKSKH